MFYRGVKMKKIESFTINHLNLYPGLYVSRKDEKEDMIVTTFDLRMTTPNKEPVLDVPAIHTIEHLGATFLRNSSKSKEIIYFGPMGCRTGFYVIFKGELNSNNIIDIMKEMFSFIAQYEGEIPGADAKSCGNYLDQNLAMAKYEANKFLNEILVDIKDENLVYPV